MNSWMLDKKVNFPILAPGGSWHRKVSLKPAAPPLPPQTDTIATTSQAPGYKQAWRIAELTQVSLAPGQGHETSARSSKGQLEQLCCTQALHLVTGPALPSSRCCSILHHLHPRNHQTKGLDLSPGKFLTNYRQLSPTGSHWGVKSLALKAPLCWFHNLHGTQMIGI